MKKLIIFIFLGLSFHAVFAQFSQENKIELYGRIWGMIKYYHPKVQKNKINWDSVFVRNYYLLKNAEDKQSYNAYLSSIFNKIGCVKTNIKPNKFFPTDTVVCNLHFQWVENSDILNNANKGFLRNLITFYIPRYNKAVEHENIGYDMKEVWKSNIKSYPNESLSMLYFFNYWNRINYFFAYKKLMDIQWDKTLQDFIPRIQAASGTKDFYLVMAELISRINDGHGWCRNKEVGYELGYNLTGIKFVYVENKTLVSDINDSSSKYLGINRGDEILEINGQTISQRRLYLEKYISGSTKANIESEINDKILGSNNNSRLTIKLMDTMGTMKEKSFFCDSMFFSKLFTYSYNKKKDVAIKLISEKYGYIDAGITTNADVRKAFRKYAKTKAIIIDLRKYGGAASYSYSKHLTNKRIPYAVLYIGNNKFPGSFTKRTYKTKPCLAFLQKKYKGKIIILTDDQTGSSMELMSMLFRATDKAIIIGRNTGGYDGACIPFLISPNFGAAYTGDAVFYPNGQQTQRIGIVPDIYVNATIKGVTLGKDEILERALLYLETGQ